MDVQFFHTSAELRQWFEANHDKARELYAGFYKKDTGKQSFTYLEALDQALCYGWIDSMQRKIDEISYAIRFTPRKPKSNWSAANIKRVGELEALGWMQPAGRKAFEERNAKKTAEK